MNQAAFPLIDWNFQTIHPALLHSDGSYTLSGLCSISERDSRRPESSPENELPNPFLLSYGWDAFLPGQISPAPDYSFNFPEYLDPTALYTSTSPYSEYPPITNTIQGSPVDHYISSLQSSPELFHPLDCLYSDYSPDSSDSHETEHSARTQPTKEANSLVPVVEIKSFPEAVSLSLDSPSSNFKEAPIFRKFASPAPTDSAFAITKKEPFLGDDAPIAEARRSNPSHAQNAKSPESIHHDPVDGPRRRRDTDSETDESCGYTVGVDARGKKFYQCKTCPDRGTNHRGDMMRHQMSAKHKTPSFECSLCNKKFTRPDALERHMRGPQSHKRKREIDPVDVEEILPPTKRGKTSSLSYYNRRC